MNQIEELQGRIQAALERISAGTAALQEARAADQVKAAEAAAAAAKAAEEAAANAANEALEQALDEEKTANAQLEERVKVLHARLQEAESKAPAGADDVAAMQAELQLLRNEAGDPAEKEALRVEVARLKSQIEAAANTAASDRERLEDQLAEAQAANDSLKAKLEEPGASAAQPAAEPSAAPDMSAEIARQNEALLRLDSELQQLRQANEELRASNAALREANAQSLGDAGLINASMEAEIEGLRAAQASDQAQVNAVLAKLEPLLATARNLPEGEEV
ncbi:colicin transporter [Leisingera aquaemixtae]|uniref:Colicin transporter n=1 Tax=Leisingera aquaemixtae TaxID=1396826 RepID=A0ABY5WNK8_9RHOB|nr:colicin transporter [Leisingera aquaemixtae]UWQ43048.1 colicin transporter [Leisingera aquaemixtae]